MIPEELFDTSPKQDGNIIVVGTSQMVGTTTLAEELASNRELTYLIKNLPRFDDFNFRIIERNDFISIGKSGEKKIKNKNKFTQKN